MFGIITSISASSGSLSSIILVLSLYPNCISSFSFGNLPRAPKTAWGCQPRLWGPLLLMGPRQMLLDRPEASETWQLAEIFTWSTWGFQFASDLGMFGKDVFVGVVFFFKKHYAKRVTFKGILKFLNKAILWLFWTGVCGYFVYIVWVLKHASSWQQLSRLLQAPRPGCPGRPHTARPWWSALMGKRGKPGAGFHLCPALPSDTLYGNSRHFFSGCVSYSDGCHGEWLVSFFGGVFCFLMVGEVTFSLF